MSYRFAYPNGAAPVASYPNMYNDYRSSYSPESFSSDSESSDDYEYQARMITHETRRPRDVVRAPTPPPIIKRVVERAPTPEAPIMERVIIRPQAQEIVERVIEQPRTPSPRIVQKEMQEEAPPPIVRTRVIKVDRPVRCNALPSFSNNYHPQSVLGSIGPPALCYNNNNSSFSSASSFEYMPQPAPPPMMMMPALQQQPPQQQMMYQPVQMQSPMTQQQQPQQQMMYQPAQMQSPMSQQPSSYMPQNYMYPVPQPGMSYGYHPMMQHTRMIPRGMPMPMMANTFAPPTNNFPNQPSFFNQMGQQLVY